MRKYKIFQTIMLFLTVVLSGLLFSSYNILDPWSDRNWLNGWYTAAICFEQQENLTGYVPTTPPELPNGSLVRTTGDTNNYISYGSEGVYYNEPRRYSYDCDCECDEDGCSCHTCYGCRYEQKFATIGGLGFSAGAWDIDRYNGALNKIGFQRLANATLIGDSTGASAELENAYAKYLETQQLYNDCKASDTYSPNNYLADTYGDSHVRRQITYEQYLALIHPTQPSLPGQPCNVNRPNANGPACKNYPIKWREAARSAMSALTKSLLSAERNIQLLQQQYNQMDYAGLCDADYNENPKTACLKSKEALAIITQGAREATYGQMALASEKKTTIQQKVYCFPSNFEDYDAAMDYLWGGNGFNPKMVSLRNETSAAFLEAARLYDAYYANASELKTNAEEAKNVLDNEKLYVITEAVTVSDFNETKIGTITERVEKWKENKLLADEALSSAARIMAKRDKGYLKGATANAKNAVKTYSPLKNTAEEIKNDAEDVVKEKRSAAQSLVQQLTGFYQRNKNEKVWYYGQQAQQALANGDSAKALGDKYNFYAAAINYARTGLNNGAIIENETMPLVSQLADLIKRAEMDGINVESEKKTLDSMKQDGSYDAQVLRQSIEAIITKASIKYGYLSDKKAELLQAINASGSCGADLLGDLDKADARMVGKAGIDYINALGKLKRISEEYKTVEEELAACQEKIVLANLNVEKMIGNGGIIKIDEPVKVSIFLLISNLGLQNGTSIEIPVELGINSTLMLSDITNGRENVEAIRTDGTKTVFTIKEIKPLRTFSINLEKNAVLAKTISAEKTVVALGDGSGAAEVKEKRRIGVYGSGRLILPNDAASATINGRSMDYVTPGFYEVVYSYKIKGAYTKKEEVETTEFGNNLQIRKKITIKPATDITTLPLRVSFSYQNVSGASITAREAAITNKQCDDSGCSFDLNNIKANKTIEVYAEFMVNNAKGEAEGVSITLPDINNCFGSGKKCGELDQNLQIKIAGINAAKEANDTATALRLKEEYESAVAAWQNEQRANYDSLVEIKDRLLKEKTDIENALKKAKTDSQIAGKLRNRAEKIANALERAGAAQTIGGELAIVKEIEGGDSRSIVEEHIGNSTARYNDLKLKLAKTGDTGTPLPFIAVEQKLSELEITGDLAAAVELSDALAEAEAYVEQREKETDKKLSEMNEEYLKIRENASEIIKEYAKQRAEAGGTEWETLFAADTEKIEKTCGEIEEAIDNKDYRLAKTKMELLQKQTTAASSALEEIKGEAERMLLNARNAYLSKRESMAWDMQQAFENEIKNIAERIMKKEYLNALKLAKQLVDRIAAYKPEAINTWLVIAAVVLAIAAAGVYYIKKGGKTAGPWNGLSFGDIEIPGFAKKKKEYKKLERINE